VDCIWPGPRLPYVEENERYVDVVRSFLAAAR